MTATVGREPRREGALPGGAEVEAAPGYGRHLLTMWGLEPTVRHLNHGGFGATPLSVLEEQRSWQRRMEANPPRFFMSELPHLLRVAAAEVASFLGTEPDRLAFVDNATSGASAVLRSLDFGTDDEILTTDHVYNALRNAIRYLVSRTGAVLREVAVPLPVRDAGEIVEAIEAGLTQRTRLIVVDHVTSGSATIFPVEAIAALGRERGIPVLIDGAHAPGLVDLDIDAIGADWYVGNCHKWLCAPKGAGFVAVSRAPAAAIHPLAISHAYGQGFTAEFDKTGTRDASAWLAIPAAIRFHAQLGGARLRQRNRALAATIAGSISQMTGMPATCSPALAPAMAALRLPGNLPATREASARVHDMLYDRYGFETAITTAGGALHLRISVQAYNEAGDFEGLAEAALAAGWTAA
jgi:isopenicillin-N epimerase